MKLLSSNDEVLLMAVRKLDDLAYGVTIRREVSTATGVDWSIGAVYEPLYRLEKRGFVESFLTHPTGERGGRSKRIFRITREGIAALAALQRIREKLDHGSERTGLARLAAKPGGRSY